MMPAVAEAQGGKRRPRRPLAELFRSEADIVPEPENGILRVRILGTASNAGDAAIAGLLDEINRTGTVFPITGLRLVYELPQVECKAGETGSNSLQEIRSDVRTCEVPEQHMFLNALGRGMTWRGFARRLDLRVATAAQTEPSITRRKVTPRVMRHACALHIIEATGDIRRVSLWLGHQSLKTTEMYLRTDPAEKLGTISEWRSPGLGKGRFTGVKDEQMAMLANV